MMRAFKRIFCIKGLVEFIESNILTTVDQVNGRWET